VSAKIDTTIIRVPLIVGASTIEGACDQMAHIIHLIGEPIDVMLKRDLKENPELAKLRGTKEARLLRENRYDKTYHGTFVNNDCQQQILKEMEEHVMALRACVEDIRARESALVELAQDFNK
jgi:hypothetical protein